MRYNIATTEIRNKNIEGIIIYACKYHSSGQLLLWVSHYRLALFEVKWNKIAVFMPLLYLMRLDQTTHSPSQWNECVKHALALHRSSFEPTTRRMTGPSATLGRVSQHCLWQWMSRMAGPSATLGRMSQHCLRQWINILMPEQNGPCLA